jgi:hypothetical protein
MSNVKILRLNNCANNSRVSQDTDKSGFKYLLDQDLINNGRCLIEVISGWSQITQQTLTGANITGTTRIVPNNIPQLVIRSNILQEGEDTITGGGGLILGTMCLTTTTAASGTITGSTSTNSANFNQNDSLSFICERLPSQIHLERLYWSDTPATPASIPVLTPANNISVLNPPLIPFEVVLKITFIDME